jgi:dsRNA-specific ribonuclease
MNRPSYTRQPRNNYNNNNTNTNNYNINNNTNKPNHFKNNYNGQYDKNNTNDRYSNEENTYKRKNNESIEKNEDQDQCNETGNDIYVQKNKNGTETYIFDPYNPLNVLITTDDIYNLLKTYGIDNTIIKNNGIEKIINNLTLYKRAFIHKSYIKRPDIENEQNNLIIAPKPEGCIELFTKSNERLEFVGDGVLECITKYYLYKRFPKENEGFMTEKKIALVKNESIGKMALEMGLHKWFILSKHEEQKNTRTNLKKLGCLFESFIGALFLDFNKLSVQDEHGWFENIFQCGPGFQMAQIFIENVFEKHVDWITLISNDDNFKNILQVLIQKEFKTTPHYIEMGKHSIDQGYHMGVFLCLGQHIHEANINNAMYSSNFNCYRDIHNYISINKRILLFLGEGKHRIKKKAEQIACSEAIIVLNGYGSV